MEHEKGKEVIKKYLIDEGIKVESIRMWQGGFTHEGTPYGCEIIATVIVDGKEECYCVPRYLVSDRIIEMKRFHKL